MNMKSIIVFIALILLSQNAFSLDVKERDKQKHIAVSTVISSSIKSYTGNSAIAFGSCMAIGTAKELYDDMQPNNKFDKEDMLANLIGCGIGLPIGNVGNRIFFDGRTIKFEWKF